MTNDNSSVSSSYGNRETKIYVHPGGEIISDHIRERQNFYGIHFLDYIRNNYNQHNEIIDIGANIGNHTLFFAEFLTCKRVHSFEPVKANFSILKKNVEKFGDKCVLYETAIGEKNDRMPLFNSQRGNSGGFSLYSYPDGSSFLVRDGIPVNSLDSYNLDNITMIKINAVNYENEVIEGAKDTILRNKPIIFLRNLHHGYPEMFPDPDPHKKQLHELGYTKKDSNIAQSFMDLWVPTPIRASSLSMSVPV